MYKGKRRSRRRGKRRRSGIGGLVKKVRYLEKQQIKAAFGMGRLHLIHQLEKSYQDLKQTETFFIPAYYQAHDYEGNSLPDFVPHSAWAELEIAHRSRVKAVYQKIEIFSTSDYAAQLKWIPIFLGEFDIKRFPQVIIDSLELSEDAVARTALSASLATQATADAALNLAIGADVFRGNTGFDGNTNLSINDLQDNEATRWLVPRQHSMYFQPRQMRTLTKHFYPTKGKPRDIQSGMIAGIYLQNANIKEGSFDFRVTTTFGEFVKDPDSFSETENYQFGGDATTDVRG